MIGFLSVIIAVIKLEVYSAKNVVVTFLLNVLIKESIVKNGKKEAICLSCEAIFSYSGCLCVHKCPKCRSKDLETLKK